LSGYVDGVYTRGANISTTMASVTVSLLGLFKQISDLKLYNVTLSADQVKMEHEINTPWYECANTTEHYPTSSAIGYGNLTWKRSNVYETCAVTCAYYMMDCQSYVLDMPSTLLDMATIANKTGYPCSEYIDGGSSTDGFSLPLESLSDFKCYFASNRAYDWLNICGASGNYYKFCPCYVLV
jgi:hypothetical protein